MYCTRYNKKLVSILCIYRVMMLLVNHTSPMFTMYSVHMCRLSTFCLSYKCHVTYTILTCIPCNIVTDT